MSRGAGRGCPGHQRHSYRARGMVRLVLPACVRCGEPNPRGVSIEEWSNLHDEVTDGARLGRYAGACAAMWAAQQCTAPLPSLEQVRAATWAADDVADLLMPVAEIEQAFRIALRPWGPIAVRAERVEGGAVEVRARSEVLGCAIGLRMLRDERRPQNAERALRRRLRDMGRALEKRAAAATEKG